MIVLPPTWVKRFAPAEYREGDENRGRMRDTERCDLYRFSGQVYIVQRRIPEQRRDY